MVALALGSALSLSLPQAQERGDHAMMLPGDMKWSDVPALPAGAKVAVLEGPPNEAKPFTMRLRFPVNYSIPAHYHSAIEHVTVIRGTFNMGLGDKLDRAKTYPLPAGAVAIMQPGTRHFAWTSEETEIQVHGIGPWTITYVEPAPRPRRNAH
jgi:quercetin dioxygenase-like cupin family protein